MIVIELNESLRTEERPDQKPILPEVHNYELRFVKRKLSITFSFSMSYNNLCQSYLKLLQIRAEGQKLNETGKSRDPGNSMRSSIRYE